MCIDAEGPRKWQRLDTIARDVMLSGTVRLRCMIITIIVALAERTTYECSVNRMHMQGRSNGGRLQVSTPRARFLGGLKNERFAI
jgi:hypothetical protein